MEVMRDWKAIVVRYVGSNAWCKIELVLHRPSAKFIIRAVRRKIRRSTIASADNYLAPPAGQQSAHTQRRSHTRRLKADHAATATIVGANSNGMKLRAAGLPPPTLAKMLTYLGLGSH